MTIHKLRYIISVLCLNYDFRVPTSYHDQAAITRLSNNLRTLESFVYIIEKNMQEDAVFCIPNPFKSKSVEERTSTPPRDDVSNTHVHSLKATPVSATAASSLLSIQEFSAVEDVVNSIAQQAAADVSTAALVPVSQDDEDVTPDDTILVTSAVPAPA